MLGNLLATKLFVPPARREPVPRERLIQRLNDGLRAEGRKFACKLTLISAPAGYGKTTLVVDWIRGEGAPSHAPPDVAWISLDEGDDDPARFLAYLAAALQSIGIELEPGPSAAAPAQDPEAFFRALINELADDARPFILVMDDYHRISNQTIHDAVAFLLEFQPPEMHLVLSTREDPSFSLSRLRGRGEMMEIRQGDLRFTLEEAAVFLNKMMALSLTPEQIRTLEARTEGWIAGLQLAALALSGLTSAQQQNDVRLFIQSFAGNFWPDDTIGIIKVASGGTGLCGFEKNWSFERAELTWDGKKGSLYKDLMNAVAQARRISQPEFCGLVWKQGAADGTRQSLATEYYERFKQLIADLRTDLNEPDLPVFVPSYMNNAALLKAVLSNMSNEDVLKAKQSAGKPPENDGDLLNILLSYINNLDLAEAKKLGSRRPYVGTVIMAQNRAGREIPNVTTVYPGKLPVGDDGTHYSSEGYIKLGKITASAVEEFYKAKE